MNNKNQVASNEIQISNFKQCVVAVGSTEFTDLIQTLDNQKFYDYLAQNGYTNLLFQIGHGKHEPVSGQRSNLNVNVHRFIVLDKEIDRSSLVISHCGAGILLEALRANKTDQPTTRCIAVVNESLMHNHQSEIADALEGYILKANVSNVMSVIEKLGEARIQVYPKPKEGIIVDLINSMLM